VNGHIVACPPSPVSGTQRRPDGTSPETPSPEPGPSTPIGGGLAAADRHLVARPQPRQGERLGGKVVDHLEPLKVQPLLQPGDREGPRVIGHPHLVAGNRRGNRDRPAPGPRQTAALPQIRIDRFADAGVVGVGQDARIEQPTVGRDQAETCVRAANIADKPSGCGLGWSHLASSSRDRSLCAALSHLNHP